MSLPPSRVPANTMPSTLSYDDSPQSSHGYPQEPSYDPKLDIGSINVEQPESVNLNGCGAHYESNRSSDSTFSRCLDVFYTDYGTKLTVEDGLLIEKPQPAFIGPFPKRPPSPEINNSAAYQKVNGEIAEAALDYYNRKHPTKYKMVKPIACCGELWCNNFWYHCNFKAKPETSKDSNENSSTEVFFAEILIGGINSRKEYLVKRCRALDASKATTMLCEICDDCGIFHPTDSCYQGHPQFQPRVLRRRLD